MNMFKKNGGFTLVELIVVIAILAILAGVAIPAYSGYITKANDAADITVLDSIATAAQAANAKTGAIQKIEVLVDDSGNITDIKVGGTSYYDHDGASGAPKWSNSDFALYMNNKVGTLKGSFSEDPDGTGAAKVAGATWTPTGGWVAGVSST